MRLLGMRIFKDKRVYSSLPVTTKFQLGTEITDEQLAFYHEYGFLHFENVFSADEVQTIHRELDQAEARLIDSKIDNINGVPITFGFDEKNNIVAQRMPFTQRESKKLDEIINSDAIESLKKLIPGSRLGFNERDGVVTNHYCQSEGSNWTKLGWHTDSIRDIFYFENIRPMLNVGIQVSPSSQEEGGLKLVPRTHRQTIWGILFRRFYLSYKPDPEEIQVNVLPGDLTVHDGRMWHMATSPTTAVSGHRRSIYFPVLCGPVRVKKESSKTPFYLRFKKTLKIKDTV